MAKLLFSLLLIVSGLVFGYLWQQRLKTTNRENVIPALRKSLQKFTLHFLVPIAFTAAVWVVSFADLRIAFLPAIGAQSLLLGGVLGLAVARILKRDGKQKGVLFCCGSFTNIGSIGALVAFVFLGESGFGLVTMYKMFEEIIYYTIGFPIARYYSGAGGSMPFLTRIREVNRDPFVRAATGSFFAGLALNLSGIPRPPFFETITGIFVPFGTFILLVSIGLGMRFSKIGNYLVEGAMISAIKFAAVPALAVSTAHALGFADINDGLPLKVVLIASSMPVAFNALIASSLYNLDLDMANSCWLISTGSLIFVLPLLAYLLTLM